MERNILKSDLRTDGSLKIEVTGDDIWMTHYEITDFLGLHTQSVVANLREIYKREELLKQNTIKESKGVIYYSLDVVLALIFRCKGGYCNAIKRWVIDRVKRPIIEQRQQIFITLKQDNTLS